jgi:hypothetical protein
MTMKPYYYILIQGNEIKNLIKFTITQDRSTRERTIIYHYPKMTAQ